MDIISPLESLAGGDVSDELAAMLASIAEITASDRPKYSSAVCRRLVRWIVCRSYAGPLRELCHLIVAAERAIGSSAGVQGYETLFWDSGVARAAAFRAFFRDNKDNAGVERLGGGIRIAYADGAFGIAYTRMPFLSALMEFLVSSCGYADLDAKLRAMPAGQVTKGAVDALANDLARQIYHYLSAHLPAAQAQRKYRAVIAFLRQSGARADDGGTVGPHRIDDDAVLAFWLAASAEAGVGGGAAGDFKSFKAVFRLMVGVRDALAAAAQAAAIDRAGPIGSDRAAGEIDPGAITPEAVDAALSPLHERQAPFDTLRTPPAGFIKYLKKTEADAVAPIVEHGESALALPLSILRLQAMGALQARLSESLRRGEDPLVLLRPDRPGGGPDAYGAFADYIGLIGDHLETSMLASFHHLLAAQREEAVTLLLYLKPHVDLSPLAPMFETPDDEDEAGPGGQVVRLKPPDTEDRLVRALTAGLDRCPELTALIGEAAGAAKRLTRKGFKDADWRGDGRSIAGRADACAAAADALIPIRDSLLKFSALLRRLARHRGGWAGQYLSDHDVFCAQFRALYGDLR